MLAEQLPYVTGLRAFTSQRTQLRLPRWGRPHTPQGEGAGQWALQSPGSSCVCVLGGRFSCVMSCFCDSRGWRERGWSLSYPDAGANFKVKGCWGET